MYHGPLRLQFGDRLAAGPSVPRLANVPPDRRGVGSKEREKGGRYRGGGGWEMNWGLIGRGMGVIWGGRVLK